ncbi:MAG TPA: GNAT family N-acetyltransferase, partial [Candidatus Bathyarchaeia archaeon]|nr:GNAT family N-acetyltransferase [Candidatus Bathyarchaeia archaeon]
MTTLQEIEIVDVPKGQRSSLEWILEESFEGWYLWHSLKTLKDVEVVKVAKLSSKPVGLVMLKNLEKGVGYVYYIAVARAHRKRGIAKMLLDRSLQIFRDSGVSEVFASIEEDNQPSEKLFA